MCGKRVAVGAGFLRAELAPSSGSDNNACRLIFSEADGLPGIVADRYNAPGGAATVDAGDCAG